MTKKYSYYDIDPEVEYEGLYDAVYKADYFTYSEMVVKQVGWLWEPYIVKGNLNIIVGDGGVGKSSFIAWLLSSISTGAKIPFTDKNFVVGNCILQNAEDDIEATTLPRLIANGADASKIVFINENYEYFCVQDYNKIEKILSELRPVAFVLDPIQAYLEDVNMNSSGEVRSALKRLELIRQQIELWVHTIL